MGYKGDSYMDSGYFFIGPADLAMEHLALEYDLYQAIYHYSPIDIDLADAIVDETLALLNYSEDLSREELRTEVLGAIGRAYTHPDNSNKILDATGSLPIAEAIVDCLMGIPMGMTICEAVLAAQAANCAIRYIGADDRYIYHGMDNQLRWSHNDECIDFSVATLMCRKFGLFQGYPYHGKLARDSDTIRERKQITI